MDCFRKEKSGRYWEIDSLRGVAIVLMIVFHFVFDLAFFGIHNLGVGDLFWWWFPRLIASIFIFLVGISLTLSWSRRRNEMGCVGHYIKRGVKIFCYGLLITLATQLFLDGGTIWFGILHFIGITIVLAIPFLGRLKMAVVGAIVVLATGLWLQGMEFSTPWLMWLGLAPTGLYTFDYFPILPWFGITLLGVVFGNLAYPGGKRMFGIRESSGFPVVRFFNCLGRNSLLIYLAHQPVLIGVVLMLFS